MELRTERLILRRWRPEDREPFAHMNADAEVMRHFPAPLSREESDAFTVRIEQEFADRGHGLWAAESLAEGSFIGFVGLHHCSFPAHFTPATEVGWRLDRPFWSRGYASEAARAVIADGFARIALKEIVSFTSTLNTRSIAVMKRLGMSHDPADDFDHPNLPDGHRLRRHVLYRIGPHPGHSRTSPQDMSITRWRSTG